MHSRYIFSKFFSFLSASANCFGLIITKITARDALIAKPFFRMYQVSLHLKLFRLSVMLINPFVVFLAIDGVSSCSNGFLRAMSNASLSSYFVNNLITSRDVFFSSGASLKLSKFSLASSELLSLFVLSIFS